MTSLPEFGVLEDVGLRAAWNHEAHQFTPWLADHLDRLSDEIGIPLELVGREVAVESFSADILARNPMDGTSVLIENQLEEGDHRHLGQVLTYLAGLEAHVVVWIASGFRDAHLSAINWLNEHTEEPFAFFAVKVRVVRIGDSPLAPIFEVVARPNNWDREVRAITRDRTATAELNEFRRNFWSHYLDRHPDESEYSAPAGPHNRARPLLGYDLVLVQFVAKDMVGVFVRGRRGADHNQVEASLEPYSNALEQRLGPPMNETGEGRFFIDRLKMDATDPSNWDEMTDWLHKRVRDYEQALQDEIGMEASE